MQRELVPACRIAVALAALWLTACGRTDLDASYAQFDRPAPPAAPMTMMPPNTMPPVTMRPPVTMPPVTMRPPVTMPPPDPPDCTQPCDDGIPCTDDRCVDGECEHTLAPEGSPCDDGDPCTEDGACSGDRCAPSTLPRVPRVLQTLPTFGEGATDAATDGALFVFAGPDRFDIVALGEGGAFVHRSSAQMAGARYVEALGERRFLVRSADGSVALLDASNPLVPGLTPLPHIAPIAPEAPDGWTILRGPTFEPMWLVSNGVVLIATSTQYVEDPNEIAYLLTAAPIDPALGQARLIDAHAYRMAAFGDFVVWTKPGGTADTSQAMGMLQLRSDGSLDAAVARPRDEIESLGCGWPRFIGASSERFATLSEENDAGYGQLCIWGAPSDTTGFPSLLVARSLDEHVHDCGVELDERYLYVSCASRHEQGALGALIANGETMRFALDVVLGSTSGLRFADGEKLSATSGALKTTIESRYLWTIGDTAIAIDLANSATPVTGPGYGRYTAIVADEGAPRALAGGLTGFNAITTVPRGPASPVVEGSPREIRFGNHRFLYPLTGCAGGDLRVLRRGDRRLNANPFLRYHVEPTTDESEAHLSPSDTIIVRRGMRAISPLQPRPVGVTRDYTFVFDSALKGWTPPDAEEPSINLTIGMARQLLRSEADGVRLVAGVPLSFALIDPAASRADPGFALTAAVPTTQPWLLDTEHGQLFAVDGDHALVGTTTGVELHALDSTHAPLAIAFSDLDPMSIVAVPLMAGERALATYVATDGKARLVQLRYGPGTLEIVGTLTTDHRILHAEPFDGRWLFAHDGGIDLADLACWQE